MGELITLILKIMEILEWILIWFILPMVISFIVTVVFGILKDKLKN